MMILEFKNGKFQIVRKVKSCWKEGQDLVITQKNDVVLRIALKELKNYGVTPEVLRVNPCVSG